jgi:hypothetical protein
MAKEPEDAEGEGKAKPRAGTKEDASTSPAALKEAISGESTYAFPEELRDDEEWERRKHDGKLDLLRRGIVSLNDQLRAKFPENFVTALFTTVNGKADASGADEKKTLRQLLIERTQDPGGGKQPPGPPLDPKTREELVALIDKAIRLINRRIEATTGQEQARFRLLREDFQATREEAGSVEPGSIDFRSLKNDILRSIRKHQIDVQA